MHEARQTEGVYERQYYSIATVRQLIMNTPEVDFRLPNYEKIIKLEYHKMFLWKLN